MKVAHIHIDCCRECPYAEDAEGMRRGKRCTQQDNKLVHAEEIDENCPLENECSAQHGIKRARGEIMTEETTLAALRLNVGLDDTAHYWLCCGSTIYPHGAETCHEAKTGHPERVRYGTLKEHYEWQLKKSSNI